MSNNLTKNEAPIMKPTGEQVELKLRIAQINTISEACTALRDFRSCGIENMRRLHFNSKLLKDLVQSLSIEVDVIRDLNQVVYGPEAYKLTPEELNTRTKELRDADRAYGAKEHKVKLFTIPNSVFEEALKDETKFTKKMISQVEVDTLMAYYDLCLEGIII